MVVKRGRNRIARRASARSARASELLGVMRADPPRESLLGVHRAATLQGRGAGQPRPSSSQSSVRTVTPSS